MYNVFSTLPVWRARKTTSKVVFPPGGTIWKETPSSYRYQCGQLLLSDWAIRKIFRERNRQQTKKNSSRSLFLCGISNWTQHKSHSLLRLDAENTLNTAIFWCQKKKKQKKILPNNCPEFSKLHFCHAFRGSHTNIYGKDCSRVSQYAWSTELNSLTGICHHSIGRYFMFNIVVQQLWSTPNTIFNINASTWNFRSQHGMMLWS